MNKQNAEPGSRRITGFLLGALVVSLAATIAAFWHTEQQTLYSLQYSADSDALRVLSPWLATDAIAAAAGNEEAFTRLDKVQSEFQNRYLALIMGSEMKPPLTAQANEKVRTDLAVLSETWSGVRTDIQLLLNKKSSVLALHHFAQTLNSLIPLLQSQYDQIVQGLLDTGAPASQVQQAQEQILRAERLLRNLSQVLAGRENFAMAADNFRRDAVLFERILNGMSEGNSALDLEKINDENMLLLLDSIKAQFKAVIDSSDSVVISAPDLYQIRRTADEIALSSNTLLTDSTMLSRSFQVIPGSTGLFAVNNNTIIVMAGMLTLLLLLLTGVQIFRGRREWQQIIADYRNNNRASVVKLMEELDQLAEGDLTIKLTVRDDVAGPIADAVNGAVEQLRARFTVIDRTSIAAQKTSEDNLQTMRKLAIASEYQRREIIDAATTIKQVAHSLDDMADRTQESVTAVENSLELTQRGGTVVQTALMDMADLVERANILSVNAAIKAAQDGEMGTNFASSFAAIAEEAQQLMQQISKVAQQLEGFVQGIRVDDQAVCQKAVTSISEIAQTAKAQSLSMGDVAATMNVIREISTQTAQGAAASATLTGNLAELADEMRQSVNAFRLPDVKHVKMDEVDSEVNREKVLSEG